MSDQKKADRGKAKQVDQPPEKPPADIQHDHGVDGWVLPGLTTGCYYIKLDRRASDSGVLRADNNLRGVHFRTGGYYANKAPVSKDTVGFFFRAHGPGTRPFILHVASCETEVRGEKVPAVIIEFSHWLACEITRDTFRMPWAVEKFGFSVLGAAGAFDEHELLPDKTMGELVLSQPIEGSSQSTSSVSAGGQHQNAAPGMGSASGDHPSICWRSDYPSIGNGRGYDQGIHPGSVWPLVVRSDMAQTTKPHDKKRN
ncbi:hypothetical protein GE09DRAFT_1252697 [Coniochaeta sp. 2T2.1]|nr:hypothetical protein GE09DRAFT_1252697 [Coniochaeta sp. 2T2.1]